MTNITKNTKTILFASLITAMILPFSGMNYAIAEKQTENQTEEKLNKIQEMLKNLESKDSSYVQQFDSQESNDVVLKRLHILEEMLSLRIYTETTKKDTTFVKQYTASLIAQMDETYDPKKVMQVVSKEREKEEGIALYSHTTPPLTSNYATSNQQKFDCVELQNEYGFDYGTVTSNNLSDSYLVVIQNYPDDIGVFEGVWCNDRDFVNGFVNFQPIQLSGSCTVGLHSVNDIQSGYCWKFGLGQPVFITANANYENNHKYSWSDGWDLIWVGQ